MPKNKDNLIACVLSAVSDTGEVLDNYSVKIYLSSILFPQVFLEGSTLERFKHKPSVGNGGFCRISIPINCQRQWLKGKKDFEKFKESMIIPYLANLSYHEATGHFANGQFAFGSDGFDEYLKNGSK